MPHRVSPTERIRGHIDELFAQDKQLPEILEDVARLGAQLLMQAALEAEITEFLGRDRYQRATACEDARPGSRNGYREVTVKTTAGPVTLARPKLRGTTEAFASRLFGSHVTKTNALETLVIASFVRGLSVRDVEAALAEALGDQAAISKSTVSSVCGQIKEEYAAWARRRLDGITLDYLFLDASFFRMHPGSPAEPVLAAWGITTGGKPAFIGLAPGSGESADAWHDFLTDLKERGLASPLLVISDGAPGLIAAIEQAFPKALRQRCLIHRARNVLAKIPAGMQAEVKDAYWAVFDTEGLKTQPGPPLAELIGNRITEMAARYSPTYPAAMKCLLADREGLTAYLRFPAEHHNRVRHSNFIERTFGETRRRTKVIGRLPGETSCLSLVWAVLDRASRGWRGLTMTSDGLRLLQDLRRSLLEPPRQLRTRTVTATQDDDRPENVSATA
ncbi:MAG TPA: IS256 family transposase [Streptosporangiaceae bacterium]|nr:IS256 family transposase [Streptosporangiaceae bacterium]